MVTLAGRLRDDPVLRPLVSLQLQLHDEIILELPRRLVPAVAALVRDAMEHVIPDSAVPFPTNIKCGRNLGDMQSIE